MKHKYIYSCHISYYKKKKKKQMKVHKCTTHDIPYASSLQESLGTGNTQP